MLSNTHTGKLLTVRDIMSVLSVGRTKLYTRITDGTLPPLLKLGVTSVLPDHEVEAIRRAVIAGYDDEQQRKLVKQLVAARETIEVLPSAA